jgi:DNA-binding MarR family transcriptional regulator
MNPTMLSRVVRRLEESGLLIRRPDPEDGRAALVEATTDGRQLDDRIHSERDDVLNRIVEQLEPAERRALVDALPVLERIADALKPRRS